MNVRRRGAAETTTWKVLIIFSALCAVSLASIGCNNSDRRANSRKSISKGIGRTKSSENLEQAADYLFRLDEFQWELAQPQILFQLNAWIKEQPADPQWIPDPMIGGLPEIWSSTVFMRQLPQKQFTLFDPNFLREAIWMRDISRWVIEKPDNARLAEQLKSAGLSADASKQLLAAEKLFDWTIRNIQLDERLSYPKLPKLAADTKSPKGAPPRTVQIEGYPGPGYTMTAWEALQRGHADDWIRGRIFTLLARQQGIEVVMLGIDNPATDFDRAWLPVVVIDKECYLFDTLLGLPIPDENDQGIVSLRQVMANPKLLSRLSVDQPYRVSSSELDRVVALIDASPGYLSHRMKILEQHLTGDRRMVLFHSASRQARRLREIEELGKIRLWRAPMEALVFTYEGRRRMLARNVGLRVEYGIEASLFRTGALVQARQRYFQGRLSDISGEVGQKETPGALSLYMACRPSKQRINSMQIERAENEPAEQWERRVEETQSIIRKTKQHATYWLGLAHLENRDYRAAESWLADMTLAKDEATPWKPGASYALARTYEATQRGDKAVEIYNNDASPQREGNRIRAAMLQRR